MLLYLLVLHRLNSVSKNKVVKIYVGLVCNNPLNRISC